MLNKGGCHVFDHGYVSVTADPGSHAVHRVGFAGLNAGGGKGIPMTPTLGGHCSGLD